MNTTTWRQQVNIQDVKWVKWEMTMSVLPYRDEGGRMKPKCKLTTSAWALCAAGVWIAVLLASCSGRTQTDPVPAAQTFFTQHHYFYTLEDIRPLAGAVTPQFYALLNRLSDEGIPMGYVVDACAWTDSQDGWFKEDPVFTVVRNNGRRAVVRMDYDFEIGSSIEPKHTLLSLHWDSPGQRWLVADMKGPDGYPYVQIHLEWLKQMRIKKRFQMPLHGRFWRMK